MPTILTTPTWTTTFDLTTTPKSFLLSDTDDYTAASIPLSGVKGNFEITSPSGVVIWNNTQYNSSADIVANVSINNNSIPLPNLANQAPEQGVYTIKYRVQITDGVNSVYYIEDTQTYNFIYTSPVVCIVPQVDCISPLFTGADTTNYTVNAVYPTLSREFVLTYPSGSGASPITNTTSATITTPTFYNGLQVLTVDSDLNYEFDNFFVSDTVTGTKSINVDCSFVCQLACCLLSLNNRLEALRGVNQVQFEQVSDQFNQVMSKLELLFLAVDCGKQTTANSLITQIKILANCTDDCICTDGTPSLVTGIGGINNVNVIVTSGGTPIIVTSNTVSGVTTYTISFDPALVTKINNSYNTVVTNTDGTITVQDSGIISDVRTFELSANYVIYNRLEFTALIQYSVLGAPVCTITVGDTLVSGSNMNSPATVANATIGSLNGKFLNNLFTVSGFMVFPANDYKVDIEAVLLGLNPAANDIYNLPKQLLCEVLDQASGTFNFRFTDMNGMPLTNDYMTTTTDIKVNIKISE